MEEDNDQLLKYPFEGCLGWAPSEEGGFARVKVISISRQAAKAVLIGNDAGMSLKAIPSSAVPIRVRVDDLLPLNPDSQDGVPDNTQLMYLHDAGLLHNLKVRFEKNQIYTFTACILLVVNPFRDLGLYSMRKMKEYYGKPIGSLPPHVFAVSDRAFRTMRAQEQNQSIVVSGESGAGKTETCKHIMRYLTAASGLQRADNRDPTPQREGTEEVNEEEIYEPIDASSLEKQLLDTNPILEAFGNAKTLRNNNSSRFGKFTEINFDQFCKICGATIVTYLLEKSRLVAQAAGERNFHVFYLLCFGASGQLKDNLHLSSPESYRILASCTEIKGRDDVTYFKELEKALLNVGIEEETQNQIWEVLAGLLHLGNVTFSAERRSSDKALIDEHTEQSLSYAAELLQMELPSMQKSLLTRNIVAAGGREHFNKPQTPQQAGHSRDALIKDIYGRLFDWILTRINQVLIPDKRKVRNFIGVLDIFGFEYFEQNSFEQLCINHANEKLQQHFNVQLSDWLDSFYSLSDWLKLQVLAQEQELYEKEAINFKAVEYEDNSDCIDLVEQPRTGLVAILDEESKMPKATDKTFGNKVHLHHDDHPRITPNRKSSKKSWKKYRDDEAFVVKHFAAEVSYQTEGFLDKNNDDLLQDLLNTATSSKHGLLEVLYSNERETEGSAGANWNTAVSKLFPPKRFKSVSRKFVGQLNELMQSLTETSSHFVRCIKPNDAQKATTLVPTSVLQQLRCSGMLETLRLMQAGFPTRTPFEDLAQRYRAFLPDVLRHLDPAEFCEALLMGLGVNRTEFQLGITKVFFRAGRMAFLEELSSRKDTEFTKTIVEKVKRWLIRRKLRRAISAVVCGVRLSWWLKRMRSLARVTRFCRIVAWAYRVWVPIAREIKHMRRGKLILSFFRMVKERHQFLVKREAAVMIQAAARGYIEYTENKERIKLMREEKAEQRRRIAEEERQRRIQARQQAEVDRRERAKAELELEKAKVLERMEQKKIDHVKAEAAVAVPKETLDRLNSINKDLKHREEIENERVESQLVKDQRTEIRLRELERLVRALSTEVVTNRTHIDRLEDVIRNSGLKVPVFEATQPSEALTGPRKLGHRRFQSDLMTVQSRARGLSFDIANDRKLAGAKSPPQASKMASSARDDGHLNLESRRPSAATAMMNRRKHGHTRMASAMPRLQLQNETIEPHRTRNQSASFPTQAAISRELAMKTRIAPSQEGAVHLSHGRVAALPRLQEPKGKPKVRVSWEAPEQRFVRPSGRDRSRTVATESPSRMRARREDDIFELADIEEKAFSIPVQRREEGSERTEKGKEEKREMGKEEENLSELTTVSSTVTALHGKLAVIRAERDARWLNNERNDRHLLMLERELESLKRMKHGTEQQSDILERKRYRRDIKLGLGLFGSRDNGSTSSSVVVSRDILLLILAGIVLLVALIAFPVPSYV